MDLEKYHTIIVSLKSCLEEMVAFVGTPSLQSSFSSEKKNYLRHLQDSFNLTTLAREQDIQIPISYDKGLVDTLKENIPLTFKSLVFRISRLKCVLNEEKEDYNSKIWNTLRFSPEEAILLDLNILYMELTLLHSLVSRHETQNTIILEKDNLIFDVLYPKLHDFIIKDELSILKKSSSRIELNH